MVEKDRTAGSAALREDIEGKAFCLNGAAIRDRNSGVAMVVVVMAQWGSNLHPPFELTIEELVGFDNGKFYSHVLHHLTSDRCSLLLVRAKQSHAKARMRGWRPFSPALSVLDRGNLLEERTMTPAVKWDEFGWRVVERLSSA